IPTGTEASRRAADDTLVTSLASDILHWRRISSYANSTYLPYGSPPLTNTSPTYSPPANTIRSTVLMTNDAMGNLPKDEFNNTNPYYTGPYFLTTYTIMDQPQFPGVLDT